MDEQKQQLPVPPNPQQPKSKALFWVVGLSVLSLAGLGTFLALRKGNDDKEPSTDEIIREANNAAPNTTSSNSGSRPNRIESGFPLKRGSRGNLVKQLQTALNSFHGANLQPDGVWGRNTAKALTAAGLSTTIDAATFASVVAGSTTQNAGSNTPDPTARRLTEREVAFRMFDLIKGRSFSHVLALLKKIPNTNVYKTVSNWFQVARNTHFMVRVSLLTGVLEAFAGTQKAQLEAEFARMGLLKNSSTGKWSFPTLGFVDGKLITTRAAAIWDGNSVTMEVPSGTVLGKELYSEDGFTQFKTIDGDTFTVLTNAIQYA
jgi:peptidoglycan hydrolase-like protein with peptidoglycan-binding domain